MTTKNETACMDKLNKTVISQFDAAIEALSLALMTEIPPALDELLVKYSDQQIYAMALYHNGDYSGYVTLSVSTELGLNLVAENYLKKSHISLEHQKLCLRWSPCDSPYHDLYCDYPLAKSNASLNCFESISEEMFNQLEAQDTDEDDIYDFLGQMDEKIHDVYTELLRKQCEKPEFKQFQANGGILYTCCGDISHQGVYSEIELINGAVKAQQVLEDLTLNLEKYN